ncbi:MAG: bifunctional acetate--CoA ligase family protein/GNAT family N-acetyltransferase [Betaproteobacteria bacterium]|nr:bifunctional acetate--CoA ligase family protein/GNAT family N-acetyltransferase [Betaproteobacteria bacterium]
MTVRNLDFLFRPRSVAVVAEAAEQGCYADVVLRNLATGGFSGAVTQVTAKKHSVFGIGAHVHLSELVTAPDHSIVCAPLRDVAGIVVELGGRGTRAVIVGPSLREKLSETQVAEARKAILDAARPQLVRVLGPGSGGLLVPAARLNASVSPVMAGRGKIALVVQSAAIAAAALDRAASKGIGFSVVVHLCAALDIDLADVLDWLAEDPETEAILVQFEVAPAGRKFMSAARAAARNKPVVAMRGEHLDCRQGQSLPFRSDDVYEAALRRAGWIRIDTLEDLFDAAAAMARVRPLRGERLAIVGNGRGLGRIAATTLLKYGGRLARLAPQTAQKLSGLMRTGAPPDNPLALPPDLSPAGWTAALEALAADTGIDAMLTVYSPSPFAAGTEVAAAIGAAAAQTAKNIFSCWVGGSAMQEAQQVAAAKGLLAHDSPEKAIGIFLGIVNYERNRELLLQMPPSVAEEFLPDLDGARAAVAEALDAGAGMLPPRAARQLLLAYGIESEEATPAGNIDEAVGAADASGYPVDIALALASDVEHALAARELRSPEDIRIAVRGLRARARKEFPGIRVSGYRLRPSIARSGLPALRLGVADDAVFGPVIYLGEAGGESRNRVVLPPLNRRLAMDLVARGGFAREAAEDERETLETELATVLVRLSQLLTDIDEITAIELDPIHVETTGVVARGRHIHVEKRGRRVGFRRFAIRPYPKELEQHIDWRGRKLLIRPIRPEDETTLADLIASLDPEDSRMRFFGTMRKLPRSQLARFTQIDYDREIALVAIERDDYGVERSLGEARMVADPDNRLAEFAILVASDVKGGGLGRRLMESLIDCARKRGIGELHGETLSENQRMQDLARKLGFTLKTGPGVVEMHLPLHPPAPLGRTE